MHLVIRFRAIALATAALFAVVACGGSSGNGLALASTQALNVRLTTEPASFDPGEQQGEYAAADRRQTFEAVLRTTKRGQGAVGAASDGYTSDTTRKGYTFKL